MKKKVNLQKSWQSYFTIIRTEGRDSDIEFMKKGLKMKIAVSACLLGENCKYNGGILFEKTAKIIEKGR